MRDGDESATLGAWLEILYISSTSVTLALVRYPKFAPYYRTSSGPSDGSLECTLWGSWGQGCHYCTQAQAGQTTHTGTACTDSRDAVET